jgi:hypothetical protein
MASNAVVVIREEKLTSTARKMVITANVPDPPALQQIAVGYEKDHCYSRILEQGSPGR